MPYIPVLHIDSYVIKCYRLMFLCDCLTLFFDNSPSRRGRQQEAVYKSNQNNNYSKKRSKLTSDLVAHLAHKRLGKEKPKYSRVLTILYSFNIFSCKEFREEPVNENYLLFLCVCAVSIYVLPLTQ